MGNVSQTQFHPVFAAQLACLNPFKTNEIQAVYVIHARKFTERATHIKTQMAKLAIPFEFIWEDDADAIAASALDRYFCPAYKTRIKECSCTLKHIAALRRIADNGLRLALVLEDDAIPARNFIMELGKIVEEAMTLDPLCAIYIGSGGNMFVPRSQLKPGRRIYEAQAARCTEAYLISAQAARARLGWLERNKIDRPTDHLFGLIDGQEKIRIYWSDPAIVTQGSMNGLFVSDLDGGRKDNPLWRVKLGFWLQRLRRKYLYRLFQK
jgi:glycosyl transferase family 25